MPPFPRIPALSVHPAQGSAKEHTCPAGIEEEYNTTLVNKDVEETIGKMDLSSGVDAEFDGESEQIMDAMMQLLQMLLLGMLMIYLHGCPVPVSSISIHCDVHRSIGLYGRLYWHC